MEESGIRTQMLPLPEESDIKTQMLPLPEEKNDHQFYIHSILNQGGKFLHFFFFVHKTTNVYKYLYIYMQGFQYFSSVPVHHYL
jgi:hypothetical protein